MKKEDEDLSNNVRKEKIETYLVEVVQRLFDTETVLRSTSVYCDTRKLAAINAGTNFNYDQGRIDQATETLKFITGENTIQKLFDLLREDSARKKTQETLETADAGMEVG